MSAIVESHLKDMEGCMRGNVSTKTMLDVESKVWLFLTYFGCQSITAILVWVKAYLERDSYIP